jgi:hypothetical protein
MARGRIAFHGTIPDAIVHFEKLGYPLPQGANAADHFIGLLTEPCDSRGVSEEERHRVRKFLDIWDEIPEEEMPRNQDSVKAGDVGHQTDTDEEENRGFGLGYMQELYWLAKR